MMVGRTTLVIAHRLATVKHADSIVVLREGRVVEEGKHDEYVFSSQLYLYKIQIQFVLHD